MLNRYLWKYIMNHICYKVNIGNENMIRIKTEVPVTTKDHSWRCIFTHFTALRFFTNT